MSRDSDCIRAPVVVAAVVLMVVVAALGWRPASSAVSYVDLIELNTICTRMCS